MPKTIHISLSVRGALNWDKCEQRRALKWITRDDGTPFDSIDELRHALMDELAAGHEMLPLGPCDNFDWKKGCRGHES